jgi:hypothetical protein
LHTEKALIWHREACPAYERQTGEPFSRQDLAILKLQGYAGETGDNEWLTSIDLAGSLQYAEEVQDHSNEHDSPDYP